jgi:hypothetical protein
MDRKQLLHFRVAIVHNPMISHETGEREWDCVYGKRNISVHIRDSDILQPLPNHKLLGTLRAVYSYLAHQPSIAETLVGITCSEIPYQLRDKYSIYRCCWNVATY